MRRLTLTLPLAIALVSSPAAAQVAGFRGAASLDLDVGYARGDDDVSAVTFGTNLRAAGGKRFPVLYAAGFDVRVGAADSPAGTGFAYEFDLHLLGFGFMLGRSARLTATAGAGVSGITSTLPVAAQFPIELRLDFNVIDRLRVTTWARTAWTAGADARAGGSPTAPFGDELSAAFALRWSKRYHPHDRSTSTGNGYYLAVTYAERLGADALGVALGYDIDAAFFGR